MNRRKLFGFIALAPLAPLVPAAIAAAPEVIEAAPKIDPKVTPSFLFMRQSVSLDYSRVVGLSVDYRPDDHRYRHAIRVEGEIWNGYTHAQKEKVWKFVEQCVYNVSLNRPFPNFEAP